MAKVILIAAVALLAMARSPSVALPTWEFDGRQMRGWSTTLATFPRGASELVAARASAGLDVAVAAPAPALVSLVSVNRVDSTTGFIGDARLIRRREVGDPGAIRQGHPSDPGAAAGKRVAVIHDTSMALQRPQRIRWRAARERRLWLVQRPLRGAQVWLTRKQP